MEKELLEAGLKAGFTEEQLEFLETYFGLSDEDEIDMLDEDEEDDDDEEDKTDESTS